MGRLTGTSFYHIPACLRNVSPEPCSNFPSAPDSYHLHGLNETGDIAQKTEGGPWWSRDAIASLCLDRLYIIVEGSDAAGFLE